MIDTLTLTLAAIGTVALITHLQAAIGDCDTGRVGNGTDGQAVGGPDTWTVAAGSAVALQLLG